MKPKRPIRNKNFIRSCEAARILGMSREYVRQMVVAKVLPPRYIFNPNSWRKIYIFDKRLIERFKDREQRAMIKWKEPVKNDWMSVVEITRAVKCTVEWINQATRKGIITPELVIAGSRQPFKLYSRKSVEEAFSNYVEPPRPIRRGHTSKTNRLIRRIIKLHAIGYNDSQIAIKTKSTQPFISKLRKEIGLAANARRGHNKPNDLKV